MPSGVGIALGGGALLGAISGAIPKNTKYDTHVDAGNATARETQAQNDAYGAYGDLQGMVGAGPGQQDVSNSVDATRGFADMLKQYQQGGYMPSANDISSSNNIAGKLFGAQREGLSQSFVDQTTQANRQAGIMGRDPNDPILQAKLRTNMSNQTNMLNAQQGGWAQQYALQQPMQRLGFAEQRSQVLGGLATQAMSNRQALAAMGSSLMDQERNFRLQTANRYGNQESGGGVGGALTGGLAGAGIGGSLAGMFGSGGMTGSSSQAMSYGAPAQNNFFNQQSYGMGQPQAQLPVFSPFTGAGQAPSPTFGNGGSNSRSFGLGY